MPPIRALRVLVICIGFAFLFVRSQLTVIAQSGEAVPGVRWAVCAMGVLFLVRAAVTERVRGDAWNAQKDMMWGLGAGAVAGALWLTFVA